MREGIVGALLALMLVSVLGIKIKALQMREQNTAETIETVSVETVSVETVPVETDIEEPLVPCDIETPKLETADTERPKKRRKNKDSCIVFKTTAYCPCEECSGGYGNHTATGKIARSDHTIAVDPDVIRYGTKVTIDGTTYTAEDCGGAVRGNHIDIYFDNHADVEHYGVRYKKVRVKR